MAEVEKYNKIFEDILKISVRYRSTGKPKERIDEFKKQLDTTFKFWPRNVMVKVMGKINCFFNQCLLIKKHLWAALIKHLLLQKKGNEKKSRTVEKN